MTNIVTVASVVKLSAAELSTLKKQLGLASEDSITNLIDKNLVAGIKVTVNGQTIDLTVSRQLGEL